MSDLLYTVDSAVIRLEIHENIIRTIRFYGLNGNIVIKSESIKELVEIFQSNGLLE